MTLQHQAVRRIPTDHGILVFGITGPRTPVHFQISAEIGPLPGADDIIVTTRRSGGASEVFTFVRSGRVLRSVEGIQQPHDFKARLAIGSRGQVQAFDVIFGEPRPNHHHTHSHGPQVGRAV